jgi:hypothetical protein
MTKKVSDRHFCNARVKSARQHSFKAIERGQGKFSMAGTYYVNDYAKKTFDKELFTAILRKVPETPGDSPAEFILLNTVAHYKNKERLGQLDEYFYRSQRYEQNSCNKGTRIGFSGLFLFF